MTTTLWTPASYGYTRRPVRANPNGSIYQQIMPEDPRNFLITANGDILNGPAEDALAQLEAAGPRGAAVLGAFAGFLFSGWKAALAGGLVGYFGGKYIANMASKVLAVSSAASTVTKATS